MKKGSPSRTAFLERLAQVKFPYDFIEPCRFLNSSVTWTGDLLSIKDRQKRGKKKKICSVVIEVFFLVKENNLPELWREDSSEEI